MSFLSKMWQRWRQTRWWVRWLTYVLTVVVGFYVVEDVRGSRALEQAKAEYQAKGFRLDADEIRGQPIPDEENFARHEIIAGEPFKEKGVSEAIRKIQYMTSSRFREPPEYHGFHGPRDGLQYYLDEDSDEPDPEGSIDTSLEMLDQYISHVREACKRPQCDWFVWIDRDDWVNSSLPHSQMGVAELALRIQTLRLGEDRPDIAAKNVKALFVMAEFKSPLYSGWRTNPFLDSATGLMAWGLERQIWTETELRDLYDSAAQAYAVHTWQNSIETFVAGPLMEQFGRSGAARRLLKEIVEYEPSFITLPDKLWFIDLEEVEPLINMSIVRVMPRGWIWQNQAGVLRWIPDPQPIASEGPYNVLLRSGVSSLSESSAAIINEQIRGDLLLIAIEAECSYLANGAYDTPEETAELPENFRYQLGPNGRPVVWYSDDEPLAESIDFDLLDHNHLWRYPPDSN